MITPYLPHPSELTTMPSTSDFPHPPRAAPSSTADTRREAGRSIDAHLQRLQAAVLRFLEERGPRGATDEQIHEALELSGDTARARRCELRDAGLIVDSGRRRKTRTGRRAVVWVKAAISGEMPSAAAAEQAPSSPAVKIPSEAPAQPPKHLVDQAAADRPDPAAPEAAASWRCPRCACTSWRDVPIHAGRSLRRDCARCGRMVRFLIWYGREVPRP